MMPLKVTKPRQLSQACCRSIADGKERAGHPSFTKCSLNLTQSCILNLDIANDIERLNDIDNTRVIYPKIPLTSSIPPSSCPPVFG